MSLYGILFIVSIIAAIPTSGVSFIALYFAKMWINSEESKKIAAAAVNGRSNDGIITIPFVSSGGIKKFFNKYGSTDIKYQRIDEPATTYLGYVKVDSSIEHVVMINRSGSITYVSSLMPPHQFGDDLLSLIHKKSFLESIISNMGSQTTA